MYAALANSHYLLEDRLALKRAVCICLGLIGNIKPIKPSTVTIRRKSK